MSNEPMDDFRSIIPKLNALAAFFESYHINHFQINDDELKISSLLEGMASADASAIDALLQGNRGKELPPEPMTPLIIDVQTIGGEGSEFYESYELPAIFDAAYDSILKKIREIETKYATTGKTERSEDDQAFVEAANDFKEIKERWIDNQKYNQVYEAAEKYWAERVKEIKGAHESQAAQSSGSHDGSHRLGRGSGAPSR